MARSWAEDVHLSDVRVPGYLVADVGKMEGLKGTGVRTVEISSICILM